MRPKDKILTEISKIKHSIELGCSTIEATYRVGMVDGMYYAIDDDKTVRHNDNEKALLKSFDEDERATNRIELLKQKDHTNTKKHESHNKTNKEILRLVDLLELQIKICDCSVGIKYDMLNKIDNIHSAIHNMECKSANIKDEDIKVNVQYKLDKEAYRQCVADMKDIEAEFKADNPVFVGVAGEDLECGDAVFKNTDGKLYKSKLEIDHIDYDNTTDHISATLKDVCGWWISKYKRNSTFDEYTIESNIAENMEYLMKRRGW